MPSDKVRSDSKRSADSTSLSERESKCQKTHGAVHKNCLMKLNELKPGLIYVLESQEGPPHNPVFVISVEVNGKKFVGRGHSKQLAKQAAAQLALDSLLSVSDHCVTVCNPDKVDALHDSNVHNTDINTNVINIQVERRVQKVILEAPDKNPVMMLNELHPGKQYTLLQESNSVPGQRFTMCITIEGQTFKGSGPNKRIAKAAAARSALSRLYNVSYYENTNASMISKVITLSQLPPPAASKIAKTIYELILKLPYDSPEHTGWTLLAGIALTTDLDMNNVEVVSLATGARCISGKNISMNGATLNDCHAAVIARRCLKRYLYSQLELHLKKKAEKSILCEMEGGGYCLRVGVKFHLFISKMPCGAARNAHSQGLVTGDMSIKGPLHNQMSCLRTKAKSGRKTTPIRTSGPVQNCNRILLGQQRLLTMSCSDKIARWNILGLQGALLSHFVKPIYLESVILGSPFETNLLYHATCGRIESAIEQLPRFFRINNPKFSYVSNPEVEPPNQVPSFSMNWTKEQEKPEIVNAETGKLYSGHVSGISKRSFFTNFNYISGKISSFTKVAAHHLYAEAKASAVDYQVAKKQVAIAFEKVGLGTWIKKPVEQDEFGLNF